SARCLDHGAIPVDGVAAHAAFVSDRASCVARRYRTLGREPAGDRAGLTSADATRSTSTPASVSFYGILELSPYGAPSAEIGARIASAGRGPPSIPHLPDSRSRPASPRTDPWHGD